MNRYQELKKELREEGEKLVVAFNEEAKVGDFARLGDTYGVLVSADYRGKLGLLPIFSTSNTQPIYLEEHNIPEVTLLGSNFAPVALHAREKALKVSAANENVPF